MGCSGSDSLSSLHVAPASPVISYVWEESDPADVGISATALSDASDTAFLDGNYTQALVVIKDSKLVYERYRGIGDIEKAAVDTANPELNIEQYRNRNRYSLATSWSAAKSFVSVLIGIAIEQGLIGSINESASLHINEWADDERSAVTIRQLLDMRSGLTPMCFHSDSGTIEVCAGSGHGGGDLIFSDDQMSACLARNLAVTGVTQPWYRSATLPYNPGDFVYSNCDTMVLGEILWRATGKNLQAYADIELFSKIGMTAHWWRDNEATAQVNGNYLAYCCLDATPRDFAKFGQLLLNNGTWNNEQIIPASYIESIKNIISTSNINGSAGYLSYGLQFWTILPAWMAGGDIYPAPNTLYSAIGFDGQYITIDYDLKMVIVRNSLYNATLNRSDSRTMKIDLVEGTNKTNFTHTMPQGLVVGSSGYRHQQLLYDLANAIIL